MFVTKRRAARCQDGYRPVQAGVRFSAKARGPSSASSDWEVSLPPDDQIFERINLTVDNPPDLIHSLSHGQWGISRDGRGDVQRLSRAPALGDNGLTSPTS